MAEKEAGNSRPKGFWKGLWYLLWKDDSFKGWLFSIIFLFLFIKFIFFPGLSLVTGTQLPLAIVESCSMYHKNNLFSDFQTWWVGHDQKYAQFSINGTEFATFPMKNGFNKGDIIFITGARPENIKVGDIIVYNTGINPSPIIHRVIDIRQENGSYVFSTIGDNNWEQFSANQSIYVNPTKIDEINIDSDQIVGVARLKIAPYLGWVKLIFYGLNGGLCRES